jgi:signal transducing adaptor molecule
LRRRQEDEELQRVLELSKQDKGGRNVYAPYQPSAPGAGSSSGAAATGGSSSAANAHASANANAYPSVTSHHAQQPATSQPLPPPPQEPEPVLDLSTATRVRALYTFTSAEVGELNFERGDVIKVLDRGFKEWWRGACNGKIGVSGMSGMSLRLPSTGPQGQG